MWPFVGPARTTRPASREVEATAIAFGSCRHVGCAHKCAELPDRDLRAVDGEGPEHQRSGAWANTEFVRIPRAAMEMIVRCIIAFLEYRSLEVLIKLDQIIVGIAHERDLIPRR